MKDRDLLVAPMIGQVVAGHDALRIVAANDAKHVGTALLGQQRIGRSWRNLQNPRRLVDLRCGDRGSGAVVPDDEHHTVSHQLLGGGHRLLGIAEVVDRDEPHLLAEHAARRIDVGHGHLRAALHLLADPGERSRDRACRPDQHLRPRGQLNAAASATIATAMMRCIGCTPKL